MAGINPLESAAEWILEFPDKFKTWLEKSEDNVWLASAGGLASYVSTWELFKRGVSYSLRKVVENRCDLKMSNNDWSKVLKKYRKTNVAREVVRDLTPRVSPHFPWISWPLRFIKGRWIQLMKNVGKLDALDKWLVHYPLGAAMEAEYWIGGSALELGLSHLTGKVLDINPLALFPLWAGAGFVGAQFRRLYMLYYLGDDVEKLVLPSSEKYSRLCEEIRQLVPQAVPTQIPAQRVAKIPNAEQPLKTPPLPQLMPVPISFFGDSPSYVAKRSLPQNEAGSDVAVKVATGAAGAITFWALMETLLAGATAVLGFLVLPGFGRDSTLKDPKQT